jgi:hypothetical protein
VHLLDDVASGQVCGQLGTLHHRGHLRLRGRMPTGKDGDGVRESPAVTENRIPFPINDPDVRAEIVKLLRRDLTPERIAGYAARYQQKSDRTVPHTPDAQESADAQTA